MSEIRIVTILIEVLLIWVVATAAIEFWHTGGRK